MNGIGFSEIVIIFLLVLLFFGSKELPDFIRKTAQLIGKLRKYSDTVRRELSDLATIGEPVQTFEDEVGKKKKVIREACYQKMSALTEEERAQKSAVITEHLLNTDEIKKANSVMIYVSAKTEVQTHQCIEKLLAMQKRVVVPYWKPGSIEIGIAEIKVFSADLAPGAQDTLEPVAGIRDNFFKSDIQMVVCPGVGFDKQGGRLGRGRGCYDYFMKELKGKIPVVGLAYECQKLDEYLPFDYHDVPVEAVITELGIQRFTGNK